MSGEVVQVKHDKPLGAAPQPVAKKRTHAQIVKDEEAVKKIAEVAEVTKRFNVASLRAFYDITCELLQAAARL